MVKCESLRINMFRITPTGKSMNFPVTLQSQAPVSLNSCLTIKGFLKKCINEEVPYGFFLRTVIVNRGNSCLASIGRFISVFEVSKRTNPE